MNVIHFEQALRSSSSLLCKRGLCYVEWMLSRYYSIYLTFSPLTNHNKIPDWNRQSSCGLSTTLRIMNMVQSQHTIWSTLTRLPTQPPGDLRRCSGDTRATSSNNFLRTSLRWLVRTPTAKRPFYTQFLCHIDSRCIVNLWRELSWENQQFEDMTWRQCQSVRLKFTPNPGLCSNDGNIIENAWNAYHACIPQRIRQKLT